MSPTEYAYYAQQLARAAGTLLLKYAANPTYTVREKSGPSDLVSEADQAAEQLIREGIKAIAPNDGFVGEESQALVGTSGVRWVVDPLDGTTNFLQGQPHWAVSIAIEDSRGSIVGVVYHPQLQEMFVAIRGAGVTLNGASLPSLWNGRLDQAVIAIGMARFGIQRPSRPGQIVQMLASKVAQTRWFGAAALDLAWCAAGRVHAVYYESRLGVWDTAAGKLICQEAGLQVGEFQLAEDLVPSLLVAPSNLYDSLGTCLQAAELTAAD